MSYFSIDELCASTTAKQLKINNTPNEEVKANMERIIPVLDSLREMWGSPIKVTSGYRCPELNKAVKGVENSQHLRGLAVDIVPANGDFDGFVKTVKLWAKTHYFDQILVEQSAYTKWVHFSPFAQRCDLKKLNV